MREKPIFSLLNIHYAHLFLLMVNHIPAIFQTLYFYQRIGMPMKKSIWQLLWIKYC